MIPGRRYLPADFLHMARRRAVVMCAVFVVAAAAGIEFVRRLPSTYRAEAVILVDTSQVPEKVIPAAVTIRLEEQLRSVTHQILSRTNLERVILEFGLYGQTAGGASEDALEEMRADVKVEMVKSDAFRLAYVASDPLLAQRVTARLAQIIVEDYAQQRTTFALDVNQFLETQLTQTRAQLSEQEARLDAYRRSHAGELPTELQANLLALGTAQTRAQAVSESLARDRERLEVLQSAMKRGTAAPPAVATAPGAAPPPDPLVQQLAAARAALGELMARVTPDHPDAVRQKRTVRELEDQAARTSTTPAPEGAPATPTTSPAPTVASDAAVETELLMNRIGPKALEHERLQRSIHDLSARVSAAPGREAELAALTRDYDLLQKMYAGLLTKAEESRLATSLEQRQADQRFRLLDPARLPDRPLGPRRVRLTGIALLAACGLALLIGGAFEFRDSSMYDEQDLLAAVDLPLVGVIGEIEFAGAWRRRVLLGAFGVLISASGYFLTLWLLQRP